MDLRGKLFEKPGNYNLNVNESPDLPGITLTITRDGEVTSWILIEPRIIPRVIRHMLVHWLKNALRRHFGLFKKFSSFGAYPKP